MTHIGLFEGIGGFSLAARWMGWETVAWCEWDPFCQKVLKHHFPEAEQHGDITKTDFSGYAGKIDVLTGGFPCQPYSSAGKRLGTEDERHLWPEMLRAIREIQPRWVVGENVRGLTNWNGGLVFDEVQADLENEGYEVTPYLLPACAVNAPHRRDRIWFVAYNTNKEQCGSEQGFPKRSNTKPNGICHAANTTKRMQQRNECGKCGTKGQEIVLDKDRETDSIQPGAVFESGTTPHPNEKRLEGTAENGCMGWEQRLMQCGPGWQWENFPTQSPICSRNDGISNRLDGITFSKWREKSIGAYGNAIVPQVTHQIFKAIEQYEYQSHQNA